MSSTTCDITCFVADYLGHTNVVNYLCYHVRSMLTEESHVYIAAES